MSGLFNNLLTFVESVTSVFGIHIIYEQPACSVEKILGASVEIRRYEPRLAVETTVQESQNNKAANEALSFLFRYISGANRGGERIAMTAPVRTDLSPSRNATTGPVETFPSAGLPRMCFFLPRSVAVAGAAAPLDPRSRVVEIPANTIAALRFSGAFTEGAGDKKRAALLDVLVKSSLRPLGEVFCLNYDPPFATPFLRRNEVAVKLAETP